MASGGSTGRAIGVALDGSSGVSFGRSSARGLGRDSGRGFEETREREFRSPFSEEAGRPFLVTNGVTTDDSSEVASGGGSRPGDGQFILGTGNPVQPVTIR